MYSVKYYTRLCREASFFVNLCTWRGVKFVGKKWEKKHEVWFCERAMCLKTNFWISANIQLASTVVQSMFCTYRSKIYSTAIWDYTWWSVAKMALAISSWWGDQQTKKAATTTNTSLTAWRCGFIITLQIKGKGKGKANFCSNSFGALLNFCIEGSGDPFLIAPSSSSWKFVCDW